MNSTRWLRVAGSLVVSCILLTLLFSWVGLDRIRDTFTHIKPRYLLLAAVFYLGGYLLRAARFYVLLDYGRVDERGRMAFIPFFAIICLHNMFNKILPVRSGEVTYVMLMKRHMDVRLGAGISSLLLARVLDLAAVCMFFITSGAAVLAGGYGVSRWVVVPAVVTAVPALSLALLVALGANRLSLVCERFQRRCRRDFPCRVSARLTTWSRQFERFSPRRHVLPSLGLSLGIWAMLYMFFMVLLVGMELRIAPLALIWGSSASIFTYILPLSGFGGFGTHELGWTAGLLVMGYAKEMAVTSGFAVNLLAALLAGLYGLAGWCILAADGRKRIRGGSSDCHGIT